MAQKRSSTDARLLSLSKPLSPTKRTRLSPVADTRSDKIPPSSPSDASVPVSSPAMSASTLQTSVCPSSENDLESSDNGLSATSSEVSSDCSDDDDDDDDDAGHDDHDITTVKPPHKTAEKTPIDPAVLAEKTQILYDKLQEFLPKLRKANQELANQSASDRNMEDVDENEQHIEMELGLGVLEEQTGTSSEQDSESTVEDESDEKPDVMQKLLNLKGDDRKGKRGILELEEPVVVADETM